MFSRITNLVGVELSKLVHQRIFYIALVFIILTVVISVFVESGPEKGVDEELPRTETTPGRADGGFVPLSNACINGFKLAIIFLLIFGSLSLSSESSSGTLRMVLIRPFQRGELLIAKALTLIIVVVIIMALVELLSLILVDSFYGLGPVVDPDYEYEPYVAQCVMSRYTLYSFILVLLPLVAIISLGLFFSTLIENTGLVVALTLLVYLTLDYFVIKLFPEIAPYLFPYYNTLYFNTLYDISYYQDLTEIWRFRVIDGWLGLIKNEFEGITDPVRQWVIIKSIIIPLGYSILFFISSLFVFHKKDILA